MRRLSRFNVLVVGHGESMRYFKSGEVSTGERRRRLEFTHTFSHFAVF